MTVSVPTTSEFNTLAARVTALEQARQPPVVVAPPTILTAKERVLNLFTSIRGRQWVLSQMCHNDMHEQTLCMQAGLDPALLIGDLYMDFSTTLSSGVIGPLLAFARVGGLIGCNAIMPNPITNGNAQDRSLINPGQMTTVGTPQYNAFITATDRIIAALKPIDDAGFALIHRCFWEADQGSFWWNVGGDPNQPGLFSVQQYQDLWRIYAARVRQTLKNVILVWSTNGNRVDHYPTECDIIGFDYYGNSPADLTNHYNALLGKSSTKPIWMAEFGSGGWQAGDPNFNVQTLLACVRNNMPALTMICAWSGEANAGWQWGRYQDLIALRSPSVLQLGDFQL